jgi:phosphoglycolate phosphatase
MAQVFPAECLLFDLDGTLVDTLPDLADAVDAMLVALGRAPAGPAAVGIWVGNGMTNLLRRALSHADGREADDALLAQARTHFAAHYGAHFCDRSRLYPGAAECLAWLRARRLPLGLVTNKPRTFTLPLLERLGIRDHFGVVLGGDDVPVQKPDPAPLFQAVRQLAPQAHHILMVGDSVNDVQAARNAGYPVVCLSYGYNHGQDIRLAHPDAVIDTLTELPPLLHVASA